MRATPAWITGQPWKLPNADLAGWIWGAEVAKGNPHAGLEPGLAVLSSVRLWNNENGAEGAQASASSPFLAWLTSLYFIGAACHRIHL
jgi:hypothetical protein